MAATIADILSYKGAEVVTVAETATAGEVVAVLAEHGIGGVVVVTGDGAPVGIAAERDVIHAVARAGIAVLDTPVAQIMSTGVPTCTPDTQVDDVAALMTQGRHRHIPVVVADRLVGIVSVGDVVRSRLESLADTAEQLQAYVSGSY